MELDFLHALRDLLASPPLDAVMSGVTYLGSGGVIWLAVAVMLFVTKRDRRLAVLLVVSLVATAVTGELIIKNVVQRLRPFITDPTIELIISAPSGYSFPSGHTASGFGCATVICRECKERWPRVAAVALAALIAFSRLYLNVHYPTDILGGIILGVCVGLLVTHIANKRFPVREERSS